MSIGLGFIDEFTDGLHEQTCLDVVTGGEEAISVFAIAHRCDQNGDDVLDIDDIYTAYWRNR